MQIEDMKKSVADMTEEELQQELLNVRKERRVHTREPKKAKAVSSSKKSAPVSIAALRALLEDKK